MNCYVLRETDLGDRAVWSVMGCMCDCVCVCVDGSSVVFVVLTVLFAWSVLTSRAWQPRTKWRKARQGHAAATWRTSR